MKLEVYVNGEPAEITLTSDQIKQVKNFKANVTERIKSYEDACQDLGITPLELSAFDFLPEKDRAYHYYDHRQVIIKRALNEGWEPDPNNSDEPKWYVWYKWSGSGSGFSLGACVYDYSDSDVGARHEFRTKELALYYASQFINEVNMCFIIKK